MFNQLLFDKLLVTTDDNGQHHVEGTSRAPFDVIYSPDTRAFVHEARHAQHDATPDSTGQTKEPAETGGLSLDVLSDQFIALVEGSSKSIMVGLPKRFSNKRPALKSLISRVLKGSERRGPRGRASERHDTRGAVAKNPAKSQTRLTPERRVELIADYAAGMPVKAIAVKHGVHRGTIPKLVQEAGVPLRVSGLSYTARVRALALYDDGLTLQEVASRLGVDDKTVRNAIVGLGGRIRPRGRRCQQAK